MLTRRLILGLWTQPMMDHRKEGRYPSTEKEGLRARRKKSPRGEKNEALSGDHVSLGK